MSYDSHALATPGSIAPVDRSLPTRGESTCHSPRAPVQLSSTSRKTFWFPAKMRGAGATRIRISFLINCSMRLTARS